VKSFEDLRSYQQAAVRFFLETPRGYLAAKAGAGKTAVALAVIAASFWDSVPGHLAVSGPRPPRRVLVVAPKRVVGQWAREARKWAYSRSLTFSEYLGIRSQRLAALEASTQVLVASHEFFPELVKELPLSSWEFDLVIYDEASRLRNGGRNGSVGWKAMNAISAKTDARIVLLSGSPRPGTAHELFAPVFLLDQGARLGKTLTGFRTAYLEPHTTNRRTGQVYKWRLRPGMEEALYDRIKDLYFAVAPDLGLKSVVIDRQVWLPSQVEEMAEKLWRTQVLDVGEIEITAASMGTATGKVHQIGQGAIYGDQKTVALVHDEKLEELAEILEEIDGPAIVVYWYDHDRSRLLRAFPEAVDITTEEGLKQAQAGKVKLALLHPASAAHGIDGLQQHFADVIWFTLTPSFELYDQANKRIVRSGQEATVRIWRIVAANGIVDPRIVDQLTVKEREQDDFYQHLEKGGKA